MDELCRKIVSYDVEIVKRSPPLAQRIFNECRQKLGLDVIKFDEVDSKD